MADIIDVNIGDQVLEVYWQDEVELNLDMNLMYIKSGQKEIQDYVDNVSKPEIDNYIETEAKPIVTEVVNTIAEPLVNEYIETETKPSIDEYVNGLKPSLQNYVNQASNYANNSQTSAKASAASSATALTSANNAKTSETNAKTSETNALSSKNAAASSATASGGYANNAKIWAEGTDAQVQALGGEKSAKGWAKASTNLDYTNITNCITEIPQDIKLELKDGTLTLKAGSKVYVPNGAGVFDEVMIASDLSTTGVSYSRPCFVTYDHVSKNIGIRDIQQCQSGTSTPGSAISGVLIYYNTSENKIYQYINNAWVARALALPLCIVNMQNSAPYITSIEQVFNGFGYIGSTVFALPGVKGLIPNGRNTDGSLKNIEFTTSNIVTNTQTATLKNYYLCIGESGNLGIGFNEYLPTENRLRNVGQKNYIKYCQAGSISFESGRITSFTPKTAFHAVDYQDVPKLATDNTFTGANTFASGDATSIATKSNIINSDITPSSAIFSNFIDGYDVNGKLISRIFTRKISNGANGIAIQAWNGSTNHVIAVNSDGTSEAPTPPASDNSTKIATTAWVNNRINDYIVETWNDGNGNWYRLYKSGWIEQGGTADVGAKVTVTFLKAFKDTNYTVVATTLGTTGEIYAQSITKTSGTAMTIYSYGGSSSFKKSWYACGQGV